MRSISTTASNNTTGFPSSSSNSPHMSAHLLNNNYQSSSTNSPLRLDWESLRKQARQLENEIDSKLVAYSKLSSNYTTSNLPMSGLAMTSAGQSSTSNNTSDLLFSSLSNEIEDALKKLTNVNSKMSDSLNSEANINSSATVHTLQRHRDILRDYSNEYEKTKRNIISFKEREKLLSNSSGNQRTMSSSSEKNLNNRRTDSGNGSTALYMKEYDHLKSSHNLIDQQIELAVSVKENLTSQRQSLRYIQTKMNSIAHKFPMINNLVQKIKFKKKKDSIVLGVVIALCLIIMLLYIF